jgi:hypothetical protein
MTPARTLSHRSLSVPGPACPPLSQWWLAGRGGALRAPCAHPQRAVAQAPHVRRPRYALAAHMGGIRSAFFSDAPAHARNRLPLLDAAATPSRVDRGQAGRGFRCLQCLAEAAATTACAAQVLPHGCAGTDPTRPSSRPLRIGLPPHKLALPWLRLQRAGTRSLFLLLQQLRLVAGLWAVRATAESVCAAR